MRKVSALILLISILVSGCATGRNMTSSNYIPEWENRIFNFKAASDTSGGRWAIKTAETTANGVGKLLLFPFALAGNVVVNAYYVVTWPFRWAIRGDKRLIVWHPLFGVGNDVASEYYSDAWNRDLV